MIGYSKPCSPEVVHIVKKPFLCKVKKYCCCKVLDLEVSNVVLPHLIAQFDFDLHRVKL